jgi:hypothetical protein
MSMTNRVACLSGIAALCLFVRPQSAFAQSADELAKQTQNPVANLISVPFQANWDVGIELLFPR